MAVHLAGSWVGEMARRMAVLMVLRKAVQKVALRDQKKGDLMAEKTAAWLVVWTVE